jgi:hypothetical protein
MSRDPFEEALSLLRELAAPAATAIDIDGPVCGICERDLTGRDGGRGHVSDCLVMRARAFVRGRDHVEARKMRKEPSP